jgi:hypothetical protein
MSGAQAKAGYLLGLVTVIVEVIHFSHLLIFLSHFVYLNIYL